MFKRMAIGCALVVAFGALGGAALAKSRQQVDLGAAVVIIELTDEDIELQVFIDGFLWDRMTLRDPDGRKIFSTRATDRLKAQGGMSEMFFASEPTHYLEEEPNFDGTVAEFLERFPEGEYGFRGRTVDGQRIGGVGTLTHVMPALPEILSPLPVGEDPPLVDPDDLVIEWEPVTTRFLGPGGVDIIEYQVILDEVEPERDEPWVTGGTRSALINLPGDVTSLTVPPEFLVPGNAYEFEILAIEASGNSTISVGEFEVAD
ncbi:MAG: fibronectin type III domain-containing protein [Myxococcales bacterium]|nr:fibronectin type III domain-containing protein [Myxococcales bacterium]